MGNRALVLFREKAWVNAQTGAQEYRVSPSVYLHWNGGPESVFNFLEETYNRIGDRRGDTSYEAARFVQTIGDWMDSEKRESTSLGIMPWPSKKVVVITHSGGQVPATVADLSDEAFVANNQGDNGIYIIDSGEGTYEIEGGYGDFPDQGTIESAFARLKDHGYTKGFRETFADIDRRLYGKALDETIHEQIQSVAISD